MSSPRRIIACVLVATVGVATAQPTSPERERALSLFRESDAHYKRGDFEKAAALLREAYDLHPEPILLYNLARALEGLGDFGGAIEQYEAYLNAATEIADRGAIERRIATLKAEVARRAAAADTAAPTASPPSDTTTIGAATALPPEHPSDRDRAGPQAGPRRWPWLLAGGGALVLGAGGAFGYLSQTRHDDAVDEPAQAEAARLQDQARGYATVANVLFVAGGLAALGGVAWGVVELRRGGDRPPARLAGARVDVGPAWLSATWSFR